MSIITINFTSPHHWHDYIGDSKIFIIIELQLLIQKHGCSNLITAAHDREKEEKTMRAGERDCVCVMCDLCRAKEIGRGEGERSAR